MKTKSVWMTGAAAMAAFVLLSGFRGGGCGHHQGPPTDAEARERMGAALSWFCGEITCTADQKTKLTAIADRLANEGLAMRAQHQGDRGQLLDLFAADRLDPAALHAKVDERSAEMTRFAHSAADAIAQVHDLLTPEQRAKVVAKIRERAGRGPGPFGEPPFGP